MTLCSEHPSRRILGWSIDYNNPFTYHGQICFEIKMSKRIRRFAQSKLYLDTGKFSQLLGEMNEDADEVIYGGILEAYKRSTKEEIGMRNEKPYWWARDIEECMKEYIAVRRRYTRFGRQDTEQTQLQVVMKEKRSRLKNLKSTIKKQKWSIILADLEEGIWGEGFRIVTSSMKKGNTSYRIPVRKRKEILRELFSQTGNLNNY